MLDDSDLKHRMDPELPSDSSQSFRVLLYSRVSSTYQVRHGQSIEAQPEALRGFARDQGWTIVDEISDRGRTGRTADKRGFQEPTVLTETAPTRCSVGHQAVSIHAKRSADP